VSGAIAASVAYVLALIPLGALFATMAYALALLLLQGRTSRREAAAVAVAFPLFVYFLFDVVLGVPLPGGPLEPVLRRLGV
jgi:putative tricarboxylic transport membrane protein